MKATLRVGSGIILVYHRIAEAKRDPFGLCVSPGVFRRQMEHIRRTCAPLTLEQFAAALSSQSLPQRAVAITFDDGYFDNLTIAAPILTSLNLPATFFVTTGQLDELHEFWWDALADSIGEDAGIRKIHQHAMQASVLDRSEQLRPWLSGRQQITTSTRNRPLMADELDRLAAKHQHEVGAHTVNHLFLPGQPPAICREELHDCKRTLENRLGRRVRSLAYPFGGVTPAISQLAADLGYEIGVTVDARAVRAQDDPLTLPRVPIGSGLSDFSRHIDTLFSGGAASA